MIVALTHDEAAFVLNELHSQGHGHGSSMDDFEPECPTCTAADKLQAVLAAGVAGTDAPGMPFKATLVFDHETRVVEGVIAADAFGVDVPRTLTREGVRLAIHAAVPSGEWNELASRCGPQDLLEFCRKFGDAVLAAGVGGPLKEKKDAS